MSVLSYGPVTLPYAHISSFRQEAVADDFAQTDFCYTKFDIQVQTVLNSNYLSVIAPSLVSPGATTNAADVMKAIRAQLLKPRQQLSFKFNGVDLIPAATAGAGTVDSRNGPIPQSCVITQMTNVTFLCTFHILAHYWENNTIGSSSPLVTNNAGNSVLYNRWNETVDIDNANYTRRIREGKYVIRSDNPVGGIADQFRSQFAVVGVPSGFVRESSSYTQDPNGLAITYRIVDKEVFKLPPSPAFEADGEYIESATKGGALRHGEVRVRLKGSKTTDQAQLIQTAVAVASSKLSTNTTNDAQTSLNLIESAVVMVKLYENEVECRMRGMMKPAVDTQGRGISDGIWGFDYQGMAFTPGSDPQGVAPQPAYLDRGTAGLLLQAAAYYDPSLAATILDPTTGQHTAGFAIGTAGVNLETTGGTLGGATQGSNSATNSQTNAPPAIVTIGTVPVDDPGGAKYTDPSQANSRSLFTDFKILSKYERDLHIYMMPITSPAGFNGNSVAFAQLGAPTLLWIVEWTAAKFAEQPQVPDPAPVDPGWVLLDDHWEPAPITIGPDGQTPLYRISGVYVYGHLNPSPLTVQNIRFGRPPWLEDSFDRTMPAATFTPRLSDAN